MDSKTMFSALVIAAAATACATAVDDGGGGSSSSTTTSGTPSPTDGGSDSTDEASSPPAADDTGSPDPTPLTYPAGRYGFTVGAVFPNRTLRGMHDGAWTTIAMLDLYDPDGTRGVNGIFLSAAVEWCTACRGEAPYLQSMWTTSYKARRARMITALLQNASSRPADQPTVERWIAAIPYSYVIDPRTMRVQQVMTGGSTAMTISGLDALLTKNGG